MRDMISCEEVFEADPQAQAEFDAVCDEWQNEAIVEQDKDETDKAVDRQWLSPTGAGRGHKSLICNDLPPIWPICI